MVDGAFRARQKVCMPKLFVYIIKECAKGGLGLFLVLLILVWLTRTLRLFDLVTAKGQDMLTLMGQATLITAPLGREIIYVCLAIGIARAFGTMQASRELHIIHVSGRIGMLWAAVTGYVIVGTFAVGLLTNWLDPLSRQRMIDWSAEIAADFLGRTLQPGQFTEAADGITVSISGRDPDGTINDFFLDDNSDPAGRTTYFAETAEIYSDDAFYMLVLNDGMVQRVTSNDQFSSVSFRSHRLSFDKFSDSNAGGDGYNERTTFDLIEELRTKSPPDPSTIWVLYLRAADCLKVGALCFFAAALVAFPNSGRNRRWLPMEMVVVAAMFAERIVESLTLSLGPTHFLIGPALLVLAGGIVLFFRLVFPFGFAIPRLAR